MIYKVSYVVVGRQHPGAITNEFKRPEVGDRVEIGKLLCEVIEVVELAPDRGDFQFLHATVRPVSADTPTPSQQPARRAARKRRVR